MWGGRLRWDLVIPTSLPGGRDDGGLIPRGVVETVHLQVVGIVFHTACCGIIPGGHCRKGVVVGERDTSGTGGIHIILSVDGRGGRRLVSDVWVLVWQLSFVVVLVSVFPIAGWTAARAARAAAFTAIVATA